MRMPPCRCHRCLQRARANDVDLHTDRTMFSCGSLAPKLARAGDGGCMDHGFARSVGWLVGWGGHYLCATCLPASLRFAPPFILCLILCLP